MFSPPLFSLLCPPSLPRKPKDPSRAKCFLWRRLPPLLFSNLTRNPVFSLNPSLHVCQKPSYVKGPLPNFYQISPRVFTKDFPPPLISLPRCWFFSTDSLTLFPPRGHQFGKEPLTFYIRWASGDSSPFSSFPFPQVHNLTFSSLALATMASESGPVFRFFLGIVICRHFDGKFKTASFFVHPHLAKVLPCTAPFLLASTRRWAFPQRTLWGCFPRMCSFS